MLTFDSHVLTGTNPCIINTAIHMLLMLGFSTCTFISLRSRPLYYTTADSFITLIQGVKKVCSAILVTYEVSNDINVTGIH